MTNLQSDIGYASAIELKESYARGDTTPVEVVKAVLERINAINPRINAFSLVMHEEALAAARQSEQRLRNREAGPLEGIPVTIKDAFDVAGQETSTGSYAIKGQVAATDNVVVERLRKAGAVIIGKTTMSEFAWSGMSRNPVTGITHNPWRHGLNAGASSAGAGAAAATGFGPLHLGSDGAGSIRMPSHFCGIFGLKPTYGRVPCVPVTNNDYGTHPGPMTRTVADAALMLETMAGPHFLDHTSCEARPDAYLAKLKGSMKGKRVAFSLDLGHARVDDEIADIVRNAARTFAGTLQADVEEVIPDWGVLGPELGRFFWSVYCGRHARLLADWEGRMSPDLVACIRAGANFSAADYINMRERKLTYVARISSFLENWDFLITPVASVAAFPVERVRPEDWPEHAWDWLAWSEFLYPFNMSSHPAASVPCGMTAAGLPVGLQIVSRRFNDLGVLQAAAAFQEALPMQRQRPPIGPAA
ncbi:amidase [Bradyrhizobium neotropicale]|uniref:amidase n=1 Tax=Bradyrhizobium neotropicale TaxID=1497615 RepID=UPI001AD65479|nr:amidase family protein [Bradyrhizobium neotropicale]MBO4223876.1 amidase [Bradyrhizobium neotropicale]